MTMASDRQPVLLRRDGESTFRQPELSGFANEAQLQALLHSHPHLVPGVSEAAVACREFRSGAGPADLVILNPDGSLTLVECKLASNPQARREIVGQVLDYASRMWRMPIEEFEARWKEREGSSPFGTDDTAPASRAEVARQLETGRFRIVLAVDGINDDLRRMIEYLNAVTAPEVTVLAFELARLSDGDVEMLLPRVFGQELALSKASGSGSSQPSWRRQDFLDWVASHQPDLLDALTALLVQIETAGFRVVNGTASTPSLIIGASGTAGDVWPISLFTTPHCMVQVRFWNLVDKGYDAAALAAELTTVAPTLVDTTALAAAGFRKRLDVDAERFRDPVLARALAAGLTSAVTTSAASLSEGSSVEG